MQPFRFFLASIFVVVVAYTAMVIADHGANLFPVFFGDIAAMTWPGQFNLDFLGFLALSAFWLAWRNDFSTAGIVLGVAGFFGGVPVLTGYLFFASLSCNDDPATLLLGPKRAGARRAAA